MSAPPDGLASFEVDRFAGRRAVVVSAHPDDETLGVGGLLQALNEVGARLELVIATDGEAAFASCDGAARAALGRCRRQEMTEALGRLGLDLEPTWLGLPDGQLERRQLAPLLGPVLEGADLCLAPWPDDPHPDHRAAGQAARRAAGATAEVWCFPIWALVWPAPEGTSLPWEIAAGHHLDPGQLEAKRAAIDAFTSQVGPGPEGQAPVVGPAARRRFEQPVEPLFGLPGSRTTPVDRFAGLYRGGPDPWGTRHRPYERRKRAVTLASLPRPRYRRALDAGCGSGALTAELADRCEQLVAVDAVEAAVAATREATAGRPGVAVHRAALPGGLPAGPFDLLVFSEVLYYLDRSDLAAVLDRVDGAAAARADLVVVDWRPVTPDAPRDADDAHDQVLERPGWDLLVEHAEPEFLLHVLRRR